MKRLFIIANWKSSKTIKEAEKWFHDFHEGFKLNPLLLGNKQIIVALSFILLEHANYCSSNLKLPINFAAQDVSPFEEGAYTGEVNARQIKEFADDVIIGHSERRRYFGEDEEMINKKIVLAQKYGLTPILCVSELKQIHDSIRQVGGHNSNYIVAYEPLFAIGSSHPDTPSNADEMGKKIKDTLGEIPVLYGGSVTSKNVKSFTQTPNIDGVLVGGASLNPLEFFKIIENA